MDTCVFKWQLDRLVSVWNSAIQQISDSIPTADTYRSTVIIDKVHERFFHSGNFIKITCMVNEHHLVQFMFILEIKFERALHLHDEGYKSDDNYGLPKQLIG